MNESSKEYALIGSYSLGEATGAIAATLAADSPLFSFRWSPAAGQAALIKLVSVSTVISGAVTTAVPMSLELVAARAFTASDSGGTAITITGNNQKLRTSFTTTLATDIRIASTGTLTAGTRTLDSQPLAGVVYGSGTAVGSTALAQTVLYSVVHRKDFPLILHPDEGFIIRNGLAGPATGTFRVFVNVHWDEVTAY